MPDLTFIIVVFIIFAILNFFDYIFTSCMFFPYLKFLEDTGIKIKPFIIVWETTRFNRKFRRLSQIKPAFLRSWFQFGANITMMCMIPAFCLVSYSFWQSLDVMTKLPQSGANASEVRPTVQSLTSNSNNNANSPILMPIIPGLTIPLSQMYFYIGSLFLCVVIHEMGHAIAACRENITIEGCGIAVYLIVPLAYVKLPYEQLQHLLPKPLLRIYSAGVWHNIILSAFALLLMWTNPITLSPAFQSGKGVSVVSVNSGSGIGQPGGLVAGDGIFYINGCKVADAISWEHCLNKFHAENNQGFCTSTNFMKLNNIKNKNTSTCCPDSDNHLCFQDMDTRINFCLPGRKLAEKANVCYNKEDCGNEVCLIPIFPLNSTRLLKIERYDKYPVLYIGDIPEIKHSVIVSGWIAKFKAISVQYVDIYETLLVYIVTFSCGLAIMNLIPCYGFDGAHLTEIMVHFYLINILEFEHRRFLINLLNLLGMFISLGALIYGILNHVY